MGMEEEEQPLRAAPPRIGGPEPEWALRARQIVVHRGRDPAT